MSIIGEYSGKGSVYRADDMCRCLYHVTQNYISPLLTLLTNERLRLKVGKEVMDKSTIGVVSNTLNEIEATLAGGIPAANGVTREALEDIYNTSIAMDWTDPGMVAVLKGKCDGYLSSYFTDSEEPELIQKKNKAY